MKAALLLLLAAISAVGAQTLTVKASWDSNIEPEVMGYNVLVGSFTGTYTKTNTVLGRLNNTCLLTNLSPGANFIAVTAFAFDGTQSFPSREVTWTNRPAIPQNFRLQATIQASVSTNGPWRDLARVSVPLGPGGERDKFRMDMAVVPIP